MDLTLYRKRCLPLAVACLAPVALHATQPPSLIIHNAIFRPWVVGIAQEANNPGKLKIFDEEPQYDQDGELSSRSRPVAELRNHGDTFKLSATRKRYWFVFYPKWTLLNLTATLRPENVPEVSAAKLNVKQSILKGLGSLKIEVKVDDTAAARVNPNVDNFENADGGALLVLN